MDVDVDEYDKLSKTDKFWLKANFKVKELGKIDKKHGEIHGAISKGWGGHDYKILPPLTKQELETLEAKYSISLPEELRSYLLYFGLGGAGPGYGINNIKEALRHAVFDKPFEYQEKYKDDGIEDTTGLLYLGTEGCATEYYLQLTGEEAGTVWCDWGSTGSSHEGSLCEFYQNWLDDSYLMLIKHQAELLQALSPTTKGDYYDADSYELALSTITKKSNHAYACSHCQFPVEYDRVSLLTVVIIIASIVISGLLGKFYFETWWFSLAGGMIAVSILAFLNEEITSKPSICPACHKSSEKPLKRIT